MSEDMKPIFIRLKQMIDAHRSAIEARVPFTMFGETRDVPLRVFKDGRPVDDNLPQWDADVWIERGDDWYAVSSANLKGKRVLVVERDDFLRSPDSYRAQ